MAGREIAVKKYVVRLSAEERATRRPIVADDTEKKNFPRSVLQAGPALISLSAHSRTTRAMSSPRGFKGRSRYTLS